MSHISSEDSVSFSFDDAVNVADVRAAVAALKNIRGKSRPLDLLVDSVTPRRVAHVAEEALRLVTCGRGLWRHSGTDIDIISAAIAKLNSDGMAIASRKRNHNRA